MAAACSVTARYYGGRLAFPGVISEFDMVEETVEVKGPDGAMVTKPVDVMKYTVL